MNQRHGWVWCVVGAMVWPALGADPPKPKPLDPQLKLKAVAMAKKIHLEFEQGQANAFAKALDEDGLFERTVQGFELKPEALAQVKGGFRQAGGLRQLVTQILSMTRNGGGYRFMRITQRDGALVARFRMTSDAGLNYHDLYFVSDGRGGFRIPDIHVYLTGEPLSQTMRRMMLPLVANLNRNALLKKIGWENVFVRNMPAIRKMMAQGRAGQFDAALKSYDALPAKVQQMKPIMVMRLMYANQMILVNAKHEKTYIAAVDEYRRVYPKDANLCMMLIDYMFVQKKWELLEKNLGRLDQLLEGDPYLDHFRGNALVAQGKAEAAKVLFRKVIQSDPKLSDPYYTLLDLAIGEKDHPQITALLIAFHRDAGLAYPDLKKQPEFAAYVRSPEFAKWMAYRNKAIE